MPPTPSSSPRVAQIHASSVAFGDGAPLALIAGPCVIETPEVMEQCASTLAEWSRANNVPLVFKASYDKANRSSISAYRGPGLAKGLAILADLKARYGFPLLVDVHRPEDAAPAAEVADILQLPAFLCRQTDLVLALAETGRVVNIKKGQFLSPWDIRHVIAKVESTGNKNILLTERGVSFGYGNLVVDMRSIPIMRSFGYPVVFDATHAVQMPGGRDSGTGGDSSFVPTLSRAACAAGCDALFWETHPNPPAALSDKDNMLPLASVPPLFTLCSTLSSLCRS